MEGEVQEAEAGAEEAEEMEEGELEEAKPLLVEAVARPGSRRSAATMA